MNRLAPWAQGAAVRAPPRGDPRPRALPELARRSAHDLGALGRRVDRVRRLASDGAAARLTPAPKPALPLNRSEESA